MHSTSQETSWTKAELATSLFEETVFVPLNQKQHNQINIPQGKLTGKDGNAIAYSVNKIHILNTSHKASEGVSILIRNGIPQSKIDLSTEL